MGSEMDLKSNGTQIHVTQKGSGELRTGLAQLLALGPRIRSEVRRVLNRGDIALVLPAWTLNVTLPDGREHEERSTATHVIEKGRDGGRRLRISNLPGPN
jgi:ketosteroid isomerase-like protein